MGLIYRVALALCAAAAALPVTAAAGALPVGYDVSFPQCGQALPTTPAFAIVGVNGGRPFSPNPCLGAGAQPSQLAWGGMAAELYINTANPGPDLSARWPRGQTTPRECDTPTRPGADTPDCAYDYGWNAAADAYSTAVLAYQSVGLAPPGATATPAAAAWWLDVEVDNSWRPDPALNVAAIRGSVDFLRNAGAANVGIYSVKSGWKQITDDTKAFTDLPSWDAGPANQVEAEGLCGYPGNTGGGVALAQFPSGGYLADVRCPPVLELAATLSAIAGTAAPMPLRVAPAQNASLTVTLTGGSLAPSASGPWTGSQAVVVGAGRRSGAAVYFRRRRAGTAAITASAPGAAPKRFEAQVKPARLAALRIAPRGPLILRVGRGIRLRVTGRDRFGNGVKANPRWRMKPSLGRLSTTGSTVRITATRPGRAVITARTGSVVRRIRVLIRP